MKGPSRCLSSLLEHYSCWCPRAGWKDLPVQCACITRLCVDNLRPKSLCLVRESQLVVGRRHQVAFHWYSGRPVQARGLGLMSPQWVCTLINTYTVDINRRYIERPAAEPSFRQRTASRQCFGVRTSSKQRGLPLLRNRPLVRQFLPAWTGCSMVWGNRLLIIRAAHPPNRGQHLCRYQPWSPSCRYII